MKKLLALILALTAVLSLCACDKDTPAPTEDENTPTISSDPTDPSIPEPTDPADPTNPSEPEEPEEPQEPTDEEWEALEDYYRYVYILEHSDGHSVDSVYDSETGRELKGAAALNHIHEKLTKIDGNMVDQFLGTAYLEEVHHYEEALALPYQTVMSRFQAQENMLLYTTKTTTDRMENTVTRDPAYADYDADGKEKYPINYIFWDMQALEPVNPSQRYDLEDCTPEYTYDEGGKITKIKYVSNGRTLCIVTPVYDDAGRRVQDTVTSNTDEQKILYGFDDNNRVVSVRWADFYSWGADSWEILFTYDAQGRVATVAKTLYEYGYNFGRPKETDTVSFSYDDQGNVIRAEHTWTDFVQGYQKTDVYSVTYNEQGLVHTTAIDHGDTIWTRSGTVKEQPTYETTLVENTYGTLYFYNPGSK